MTKEQQSPSSVALSPAPLPECRTDFVSYPFAAQAHWGPWLRMLIKAHRKGKQHRIAHPHGQLKWLDYKAGWMAGRAANPGATP